MTENALLDRTVLAELSKEGSLVKKIHDNTHEMAQRELFRFTVNKEYSQALKAANAGITETAKAGITTNYFIPILENESEEGYWENIRRFDDGRLYFDGVHEMKYPKQSTLSVVFEKGVVRDGDEVRNFDDWEWKNRLAWAVARKLAKNFLERHLDVTLLRANIHITNEYKKELNYKSTIVEMHFLRITWG